jgi:uncharacterized protein YxjI
MGFMVKLYLKQKFFSFADRYKVFDEKQKVVFHCEGKMFSFSHRVDIYDTEKDTMLFTLRRKLFTLMPRFTLTNPAGEEVALIKKRFTVFSHKLDITSKFGDLRIDGDIFAHSFSIVQNEKIVVDFTKKWISWGDSYEITVYPEENLGFYVALVIMIDSCLHDNRNDGHLITFNR